MQTLIDPFEVIAAEPWRLEPHTAAEHLSGRRWSAWPHLRYIGEQIAEAIVNGGGRLIVNLPPGVGKSELLSHWTPTWYLDNDPTRRVILASHGAELASHWGRTVRNEFENNPRLTTRLREDSQAAGRWNTPEGGGMVSAGVGGGITGFRGNLLLVDDPHPTWEEAMSPVHRRRVIEWFGGTLQDRAEPGATIVLLMHRWHPDDLAGHLIEKHPDVWRVIRLPALAEAADPLGRTPGQALCPQRFDRAALLGIRSVTPVPMWDAKYQQNPTGTAAERLYDHYVQAIHEDKSLELVTDRALDVSFDFNRNPGMHVIIGQQFEDRDLITAVHEIHGPYMKLQASLKDLGDLVDRLGGWQWPMLRVFGDATGTQDRAETTATSYQQIVQYIESKRWPYGLYVPAANPPQRDRIDTVNQALRDNGGDVHYKFHPRCVRLRTDLREMRPGEDGLPDKSDARLSHASDAEGYRICWLRPIAGIRMSTRRATVYRNN